MAVIGSDDGSFPLSTSEHAQDAGLLKSDDVFRRELFSAGEAGLVRLRGELACNRREVHLGRPYQLFCLNLDTFVNSAFQDGADDRRDIGA